MKRKLLALAVILVFGVSLLIITQFGEGTAAISGHATARGAKKAECEQVSFLEDPEEIVKCSVDYDAKPKLKQQKKVYLAYEKNSNIANELKKGGKTLQEIVNYVGKKVIFSYNEKKNPGGPKHKCLGANEVGAVGFELSALDGTIEESCIVVQNAKNQELVSWLVDVDV